MNMNIDENIASLQGSISAKPLPWQVSLMSIEYVVHSLYCMYRGEDISEFLPAPDIILLADVVYYEEVCMQ